LFPTLGQGSVMLETFTKRDQEKKNGRGKKEKTKCCTTDDRLLAPTKNSGRKVKGRGALPLLPISSREMFKGRERAKEKGKGGIEAPVPLLLSLLREEK